MERKRRHAAGCAVERGEPGAVVVALGALLSGNWTEGGVGREQQRLRVLVARLRDQRGPEQALCLRDAPVARGVEALPCAQSMAEVRFRRGALSALDANARQIERVEDHDRV